MFDDESLAQLKKLTETCRVSMCHVVRQAVRNAYAMTIEQRPTCANGTSCHCPHTHR